MDKASCKALPLLHRSEAHSEELSPAREPVMEAAAAMLMASLLSFLSDPMEMAVHRVDPVAADVAHSVVVMFRLRIVTQVRVSFKTTLTSVLRTILRFPLLKDWSADEDVAVAAEMEMDSVAVAAVDSVAVPLL